MKEEVEMLISALASPSAEQKQKKISRKKNIIIITPHWRLTFDSNASNARTTEINRIRDARNDFIINWVNEHAAESLIKKKSHKLYSEWAGTVSTRQARH